MLRNAFHRLFVLLFLIVLLTSSALPQSRWKWKNPLPEGNPISDVTRIDDSHLIAVGMLGYILKSDDLGETWYLCESSVQVNLTKVFFVDEQYGWIIGESGIILKTTDGGDHWSRLNSGNSADLKDLAFANRDTGYVVGFQQTVLKTVDGGLSWQLLDLPQPADHLSVSFTSSLNGWISSSGNNLLHTTDGGLTWTVVHPVTDPAVDLNLERVYFVDADTGWVTGFGEPVPIYKTTDGGISWEQQGNFSPICGCFRTTDMSFLDGQHGWISSLVWDSELGMIYWTEDGGTNWTQQMIGSPISGIQLLEPGHGVAVGAGHDLYSEYYYSQAEFDYSFIKTSGDNFVTWQNKLGGVNDAMENSFLKIQFPAANIGYVQSRTDLFKSIDHGNSWMRLDLDGEFSLLDMQFLDASVGMALVYTSSTSDTMFIRTNDGGMTWQYVTLALGQYEYADVFYFKDIDHGWIFTNRTSYEHKLLITNDGGTSWSVNTVNLNAVGDIDKLLFTDLQNGWFISDYYHLYHTINGGMDWMDVVLPPNTIVSDIFFLDTLHGWLSANTGLLKTEDGGQTWYSLPVNEAQYFNTVFFFNAVEGWTANYEGRIFRTDDGGSTWSEQEWITHYPIKSIFSSGGDECWAAGQCGMILHLDDGLVSAKDIQPDRVPGLIQVSPNPGNTCTTVTVDAPYSGNALMQLRDLNGKPVTGSQLIHLDKGIREFPLRIDSLANGLYLIDIILIPDDHHNAVRQFSSAKLLIY